MMMIHTTINSGEMTPQKDLAEQSTPEAILKHDCIIIIFLYAFRRRKHSPLSFYLARWLVICVKNVPMPQCNDFE